MRLLAPVLLAVIPAGALAAEAAPPYWASIRAGQAMMRTGPGRTYPASWLYRRVDLPLRVVASRKEWRKVEDPDGTQGWMLANLLSSARTAVVRAGGPIAMVQQPTVGAKLLWRAAPGVVGRVSACGNGWCRFDVKGRAGYVAVGALWGVEPGETLP